MNSKRKIPVAEPAIGKEELDFVNEAVTSGWVSSAGSFIGRFEKLFAEYCDAKYAFATTSGTSALHLALESLDITFGDEVIVPTFSFIATANAVSYTGAKPIFVDSENTTWNIAPELIEAAVSEKTKAIIPVYISGRSGNLKQISSLARKNKIKIINNIPGLVVRRNPSTVSLTIVGGVDYIAEVQPIDINVFINFTSEWSPKKQFYEPKVIVPAGIISWRDLTPRNIELAVAKEQD